MQVRGSSPVTVPDNNNLYKKVRASDRDSPPPGSIPREEQRHLSRSSSHLSCEGEGHFIPEEHDVSTNYSFLYTNNNKREIKSRMVNISLKLATYGCPSVPMWGFVNAALGH